MKTEKSGSFDVKNYVVIMAHIHCVQKKTPTHIFFHISMSDG